MRLNLEKAPTEGETAGTSPAEKTSPCFDGKDCDCSVIQ